VKKDKRCAVPSGETSNAMQNNPEEEMTHSRAMHGDARDAMRKFDATVAAEAANSSCVVLVFVDGRRSRHRQGPGLFGASHAWI
jgi:hypothetical protein